MLQLKWVWKNMEGKRRFFIIGMLLSVVTSAMTVITPKLTQLLIDDVFRGSYYRKGNVRQPGDSGTGVF